MNRPCFLGGEGGRAECLCFYSKKIREIEEKFFNKYSLFQKKLGLSASKIKISQSRILIKFGGNELLKLKTMSGLNSLIFFK